MRITFPIKNKALRITIEDLKVDKPVEHILQNRVDMGIMPLTRGRLKREKKRGYHSS